MSTSATTPQASPPDDGPPSGSSVVRVLRAVPIGLERFFRDDCPQHAAAIGYRVLVSLAPLAIVLVALAGLVLRDDELRADVVDAIVDELPISDDGRGDVERAIEAIASPASLAGFLALFAFAITASGMIAAVRTGLETAMRVDDTRPVARSKLLDLAFVMVTGILVLGVVALGALSNLALEALEPAFDAVGLDGSQWPGTVAGYGLSITVDAGVVLLLYRGLPERPLPYRACFVGAAVTAVLLLALSLVSGWVYSRTLEMSPIYGSLTTLFVFLYAVYLYACILLLGATVATAWAHPPPSDGVPVREQLRRGVIGLFVRRSQDGRPPAGRRRAAPSPKE